MPQNLLKNGDFETDWSQEKSHRCLVIPPAPAPVYEKDVGNVFTPPGWTVWFRHTTEYAQPEVQDAWRADDARRVRSGEKALKFFTYSRCHDGGVFQQVAVESGTELRLTAWIHAWSNHEDVNMYECWKCFSNVHIEMGADFAPCPNCETGINRDCLKAFPRPNDGRWSEGAGDKPFSVVASEDVDDNQRNFTFALGIDPTGGTNPLADSVAWGDGKHIYNEYAKIPQVEAPAQGNLVTVFMRSTTLWPFRHNDFYLDDVELVAIGDPSEQPDPGPVEWNYPVIEKGSNLGVHTIWSGKVLDYARNLNAGGARFPVVKSVDDLSLLVQIKQLYPDTITIGRLTSEWEHCQEVSAPGANLDDLADKLLGVILDKIESDPQLAAAVNYWEPGNEPDPPGTDGYRRLSELMIILMDKAEAHDLKLAIFTLNFGTPEWDEMQAMVESGVFAVAREGGHILALHEGLHSANDPIDKWHGDKIPGSPIVEGAGPLCFRYRYLYHLLQQRGEVVPLVVSEWCGYDQRELSVSEIVQRVAWYDRLARENYYVWAFCPFTLGPTKDWKTHDYEKAYPALVDYMLGIKNDPNALPTEPQPEPPPEQPCRGAPRVQYERTVLLLPPTADATWAHAVVDATWDSKRISIIPSADDGGIGDLDVRNVIAVNPSEWQGDLKEFFDAYYPGVNYRAVEAASPAELLALLSEEL